MTDEALAGAGLRPVVWGGNQDFHSKRRETGHGSIFLLCNFERTGNFEVKLNVEGLQPELCDPVTGEIRTLATWQAVAGGTRVRFQVHDLADSWFLVFRTPPRAVPVTDVDGPLDIWHDETGKLVADGTKSGRYPLVLGDGTRKAVTIEAHHAPVALTPHGPPDARGLQECRGTFRIPKAMPLGANLRLDLGEVAIMAGRTLNGQALETRWMPPFAWNIGSLARAGENALKITVSPLNKDTPAAISGPVRLRCETVTWAGELPTAGAGSRKPNYWRARS